MIRFYPENNGRNPFEGTWNGVYDGAGIEVVIESSTWTASLDGSTYTGTYTHNGNTATVMMGDEILGTAAVSGNTMTVNDLGITLSKGPTGNGGGNPFEGTWIGYDPGSDRIRLIVSSSNWIISWPDDTERDSQLGVYTYGGNRATLTDTDGYAMGTAAVSGNTMTVFITGYGRFVLSKSSESVKPPSVDDFAHLEPDMTPNSSRKTGRVNATTQIGIPDNLPSGSATFAVHPDDAAIAAIVSQTGNSCTVRGLSVGSARIIVTAGGQSATVIITIAPSQAFYTLPENQVRELGQGTSVDPWWTEDINRPDTLPGDSESYQSEPTYQLAWNWRNPNQSYGASGTNCGIDILAYFVDPANGNRRGWVRTTYGNGGWHYDLNGVTNTMTDGVQTVGDVELKLQPEFFYDNGVPYLQITHILTNKGSTRLTGQKFGASADVMIYGNDKAPLTYLQYGALMTNATGSSTLPSLKFRLVCQNIQGVNDVSTLWLGTFGTERSNVYADQRNDITIADNRDTALNFSYQNIELNPGESKRFVVRFTQVQ